MEIDRLITRCCVAEQLEVEDDKIITCKDLLPLLEELKSLRTENSSLKNRVAYLEEKIKLKDQHTEVSNLPICYKCCANARKGKVFQKVLCRIKNEEILGVYSCENFHRCSLLEDETA